MDPVRKKFQDVTNFYGQMAEMDAQGRLLIPAPELGSYLAQFIQPGLRLTVIGSDRAVLAQVDALAVATIVKRID